MYLHVKTGWSDGGSLSPQEVGSKPKEHEKSNKTADDDGVVSDPLVEKLRQQR